MEGMGAEALTERPSVAVLPSCPRHGKPKFSLSIMQAAVYRRGRSASENTGCYLN